MKQNAQKRLFVISVFGLALACGLTACGNSQSNAPVSPDAAILTTAVTPDLKPMRHRASECPRNILGTWVTTNDQGVNIERTYSFEGRALIEQATERLVYDGQIHQLPETHGMRSWFVGGCRNKTAYGQLWTLNGANPIKIDTIVVSRRRNLAVGNEVNGYKIPFMHIYERK